MRSGIFDEEIEPKLQKSVQTLHDLTVVILAGGLGTRLRSVVTDRPKPLAEVDGRPFVTYLLDQVAVAGLQRIVLCTGYRGEQVAATLKTRYNDLSLYYSQEIQPLGTAGALRLALPFLTSETILVMNGDSICECDLAAFWKWHTSHQSVISLMLTQVSDISRYGQVELDDHHAVIQFTEKSVRGDDSLILASRKLTSLPVSFFIPVCNEWLTALCFA